MPYQLSRPAACRAAYSDRMTRIGKPYGTLKAAIKAAIDKSDCLPIDIDDEQGTAIATIHRFTYANGPKKGQATIAINLPEAWLKTMFGDDF